MTVKVFRSTDYGAPANTNAAGALIAILDACLVNGYGSQTVGITSTGGVATVTTPVAHALQNGTFMRISGANESAYNGDFAITVTGATTFTYAVTGSPTSPATGTITSKVAPSDWTKPFSGTNVAAYKQGAGSNGFYLKVVDPIASLNTWAAIVGFETMTSIDSGTGQFPSVVQNATCGFVKSESASAQPYTIIATEKVIIAMMNKDSTNILMTIFGDFLSSKSGDSFNTALIAPAFNGADTNHYAFSNISTAITNHYVARSHTQIGGSVNVGKHSGDVASSGIGASGFPYPAPIDNALHLSPITIHEPSICNRGYLAGVWNPLHNKPFSTGDIIIGSGDFSGKKFIAFTLRTNVAQVLVEVSNTW
jgi:hypothetical protein